jgi:hypothetical protein
MYRYRKYSETSILCPLNLRFPGIYAINLCFPWIYAINLCFHWIYAINLCLPWIYAINLCLPWIYAINLCLPWIYAINIQSLLKGHGRSGDRIPVRARFSAPVQTGPGAHPASCTMGTRSFLGVKSGQGVMLTPHPLLVPWSWKSRAIPLLPLWPVRPVQSLRACTRVHFTFTLQ